jgi:hypothetical protein
MDAVVERQLNECRVTRLFGEQNRQDAVVMEKLRSAPLFSLSADRFAYVFCKDGSPASDEKIKRLRGQLVNIYINSARARFKAKAAKAWLSESQKALALLTKGLESLNEVRPSIQQEFRPALEHALGFSPDDPKGEHESNSFGVQSQQIRLEMVPHVMNLERLIRSEDAKQPGGRKKRLRVLVDLLADWWIAETGSLVAPYVVANRRDGDTAVVHERRGEFISLAIAVFGEVDRFKESEIVSAVINMHKDRFVEQKLQPKKTAK